MYTFLHIPYRMVCGSRFNLQSESEVSFSKLAITPSLKGTTTEETAQAKQYWFIVLALSQYVTSHAQYSVACSAKTDTAIPQTLITLIKFTHCLTNQLN